MAINAVPMKEAEGKFISDKDLDRLTDIISALGHVAYLIRALETGELEQEPWGLSYMVKSSANDLAEIVNPLAFPDAYEKRGKA